MTNDLKTLVNSMKNTKYSLIDKFVSTEDIIKILKEVGNFIKEHQNRGYAVYMKDFGLFTVFNQKLLVSHHPLKYVISRKPVFQFSHRIASKFWIRWSRQIADTKIPQKLLNPSVIAINCGVNREKVIFCLNELVLFIAKSLSENKSVQVPIYGIGTLKITGDEWKMDFDKEYSKSVSMNNVLHVVDDF